jgi:hypothetical protein
MPKERTTYRNDGHIGVEGFLVVFIFGLLSAVAVGAGYRLLDRYGIFGRPVWPPVLLFGGAALLGVVVGLASRVTIVRHQGFTAAMGAVFGAVALYTAWVTFLTMMVADISQRMAGEAGEGVPMHLVIAPKEVWSFVRIMPELLARINPAAAGSAIGYYVTWLVEALVWIVVPAAVGWWWNRGLPYCSRTNSWCDRRLVVGPFEPVRNVAELRDALTGGDFAPFFALATGDPASPLYTQAVVRFAEGERGSHYLTLTTVDLAGGAPATAQGGADGGTPGEPIPSATPEGSPAPETSDAPSGDFFDRFVPVKNQRPVVVVQNLMMTKHEFDRLVARWDEMRAELAPTALPAADANPPASPAAAASGDKPAD